jgi:hypothetical protein
MRAGALRFAVKEAPVVLPSAKNAIALFVGLCAAGLILEVGLRMTGRFRSQGIHTVSEQDYRRIPGPWEPNQDYVDNTNTALPYHSQTNSLGLRGPETTLKPDGPRVLVIGDSFWRRRSEIRPFAARKVIQSEGGPFYVLLT